MLSQYDRQQFANRIKIQLEQCNYGFQTNDKHYYDDSFSIHETMNMKAIKELIIRLNVWIIKGTKDSGTIKYPEAKRRIDYVLDDNDINKCKVNLLKFKK